MPRRSLIVIPSAAEVILTATAVLLLVVLYFFFIFVSDFGAGRFFDCDDEWSWDFSSEEADAAAGSCGKVKPDDAMLCEGFAVWNVKKGRGSNCFNFPLFEPLPFNFRAVSVKKYLRSI